MDASKQAVLSALSLFYNGAGGALLHIPVSYHWPPIGPLFVRVALVLGTLSQCLFASLTFLFNLHFVGHIYKSHFNALYSFSASAAWGLD